MHFVLRMFNIEALNSWFGFSRRERRSGSILLGIIIVIIAVRILLPEQTSLLTVYSLNADITDMDNGGTGETVFKSVTAKTKGSVSSNSDSQFKSDSESDAVISYKTGNRKQTSYGESKLTQKSKLIEINGSDSAALVTLPGIGPVLSSRIIKFRNLLGGFASVDQLKEVYGLPEETFNLIRGRVYTDTTLLRLVQVNAADYRTLTRFPYLEKSEVSAILKYRELKGKLNSISDLTENKLINSEKAEKIRPYLRFD